MKHACKHLATILLAALPGGCIPAIAAVPLRWTVETSRATPQRIDIYRGETVTVAADLTSYGRPLALAGEAALYVQTNGMGVAWWTVPATVVSNRIEATLAPGDYPADATLLNCFLGGPALNYRAAFAARILGAPGPAPNTVLPPVATLDFGALEILNAPYYTRAESDARYGVASITAEVATNIASAVSGAATNAVVDGLRYGLGLGTGAFFGDRSNRIGLGYAGGLYYLRGETGGWDASYKIVRMDDLSPYALKTDLPDTSAFLVRSGGSATNLAVYAKPGREEAEPALSVHGYVDASHGFVSGIDGNGGFLYVQDSAVSARLCYDPDSDNLAWDNGEGLFPAKLNGYVQKSVTIVERMNQSVQKVNVTSAGFVRVNLPKTKEGTVGDMVLYVFNGNTDEVSLIIDSLTSFYAEDDSVKDPLGPGVTALYFTEISHGVWAVGRKSLNLITVE